VKKTATVFLLSVQQPLSCPACAHNSKSTLKKAVTVFIVSVQQPLSSPACAQN
jgi:hypothetical protein